MAINGKGGRMAKLERLERGSKSHQRKFNTLVSVVELNRLLAGKGIKLVETPGGLQVSVDFALLGLDPNSAGSGLGQPPVTEHFQVTVDDQGRWVFSDGLVADWIEVNEEDCDTGETYVVRLLGNRRVAE